MQVWISVAEAAEILGVDPRTVQRSLVDQEWGDEGHDWRYRPFVRRRIYQLRRSAVLRKAGR